MRQTGSDSSESQNFFLVFLFDVNESAWHPMVFYEPADGDTQKLY